jgi:hypothetical protein
LGESSGRVLCSVVRSLELSRLLLADTVEKGKNEPIKIFACTPVETGFS